MSHSPTPSDDTNTHSPTLVKRPWTPEEDELLIDAVTKYGAARWSMIATTIASGRVGKQCRERWTQHLSPDLKRTDWSTEEDNAILQGVAVMGTRWCDIVKDTVLSGRTDNSIKNRFYALQRKMKASVKGTGIGKVTGGKGSSGKGTEEAIAVVLTRTERIVAICKELAFATDELDRDLLIEKLTQALHEDDSSSAFKEALPHEPVEVVDDDDLVSLLDEASTRLHLQELMSETTSVPAAHEEPSAQDLSELVELPLAETMSAATTADAARDAAASPTSTASAASAATTTEGEANTLAIAAPCPSLADDSLPGSPSSSAGSSEATVSPNASPDRATGEKAADAWALDSATSHLLGGKLAHKAMLTPLSVPADETTAGGCSPKRMRTTSTGAWLAGVAGTEEPAIARDAPASPTAAKQTTMMHAVTGTKEPGMAAAQKDAELWLSDLCDLLGEEAAQAGHAGTKEPVVPAACAKRKAAAMM